MKLKLEESKENDGQSELGHKRQLPRFISNNISSPWVQFCLNCLHDGSACLMNERAGED